MSRCAFILFVSLIGTVLVTPRLSAQDSVVGKTWDITFRENGKPEFKRRLRATPDGRLFNRETQIGTYVEKGERVRCVIDNLPVKGTFELVKLRRGKLHPWWAGSFTAEDGTKREVRLRLVAD